MLFQFLAPAFMPVVVQEIPSEDVIAYHQKHSSVVVPMLLKEKDEKEHEEFFSVSSSTQLLDLTSHSFNLAASHGTIDSFIQNERWFPQPSLLALFCTFLI